MKDFGQSIILIPTLNERENLKQLIPAIFALIPEISVLIADDNSSDGSQELVGSLMTEFPNLFLFKRRGRRGYGRSSIDGFRWILERGYSSLVTMDADFSHDFNVVPALLEKLVSSNVVVGSRYIKGGGVKNWNFFRKVLSRFANLYVGLILRLPLADATSGFNAYNTDALKKINLDKIDSDGYAFLVELKYRLSRVGCKFGEYPIIFSERREGQSKMSAHVIWESVWLPWRLKFRI